MNARVVGAWLLVSLCVLAIWTFSGDGFSGASTSRFLAPFLRWLHPEITREQLRMVHWLVRKGAHVAEYAVLGLLALRALRLTLAAATPLLVALCLALVVVVAATDELHQSRVRSRSGSLRDVALDFAGGTLGVTLLLALSRRPPQVAAASRDRA